MSEENQDKEVVVNALDAGLKMNKGHEALNLWVAIAINEDGDEGIVAVGKGRMVMPLLCSEFGNVDAIVAMCKEVLKTDQTKRIVIRHFSNPVDIQEITSE